MDIEAPMAGTVKEVLVQPGDAVAKDQELLIIESMKMEIPVESPGGGRVTEVLVGATQQVDEGQVLLRIA
jgi:acetyl-CoA carboxylase biotin carboxyl carrier protein